MEDILPELVSFLKFALVAGVVVWLSMKLMENYVNLKLTLQNQQIHAERDKAILTVKMQACERLLVFLDRVSIPNLVGRLKTQQSMTEDLSTYMIVSIQKEFEYNVTQQLYVSDKLWQIIYLIKDELTAAINLLSDEKDGPLTVKEYTGKLFEYHHKQGEGLIRKGHQAIKEEISKII